MKQSICELDDCDKKVALCLDGLQRIPEFPNYNETNEGEEFQIGEGMDYEKKITEEAVKANPELFEILV